METTDARKRREERELADRTRLDEFTPDAARGEGGCVCHLAPESFDLSCNRCRLAASIPVAAVQELAASWEKYAPSALSRITETTYLALADDLRALIAAHAPSTPEAQQAPAADLGELRRLMLNAEGVAAAEQANREELEERVTALAGEWESIASERKPHLGCLDMYRHLAAELRALLAPTDAPRDEEGGA